ncbi:MAG: methylenetetrahydrofolate--tRNA-(uracil(54)-C(5))-methyltransferase (FADH(2)-oxidizing) TrmFO [Clostridiales bacterium]|nr:methylenetetrahydrofolate--tRNA-(uracil(54)-C(5))-methyltransferase (FADH(2)-oxidizing) TrmFO [Clostridiales bacterium]
MSGTATAVGQAPEHTAADTRLMVVGAGLAGCEAAWQAARLGVRVRLIDMKPKRLTAAHHSDDFAELVCSNSLGAASTENAKGLLKQELRELGSLVVRCADENRVPAGGALAVDRLRFSEAVTRAICADGNIEIECAEVGEIPAARPCVIATGPLTTDGLSANIRERLGSGSLYFFDAAAPIVALRSVDESRTFRASRYDKGGGDDYVNCPMTREEYQIFTDALVAAETAEQKDFEETKLFSGCMPVESIAKRGPDTLRFGPLKPKGLIDPVTGREPYAVVQLRQDDAEGRLYNLVGFQTRLRFGEQKRVFGLIPGLANAEFVRYGVMHRNTFLDSPRLLKADYAARREPKLFFAGQITGVEGYVESVSSGLVAGISAARGLLGLPAVQLPPETMTGALAKYVSSYAGADFQPMNANFGILAQPEQTEPLCATRRRLSKRERNRFYAERAIEAIRAFAARLE